VSTNKILNIILIWSHSWWYECFFIVTIFFIWSSHLKTFITHRYNVIFYILSCSNHKRYDDITYANITLPEKNHRGFAILRRKDVHLFLCVYRLRVSVRRNQLYPGGFRFFPVFDLKPLATESTAFCQWRRLSHPPNHPPSIRLPILSYYS